MPSIQGPVSQPAPQAQVNAQPAAAANAQPADLTASYAERALPKLGINVKYNPSISEASVASSLPAVSVHRTVHGQLGMTTNALHNVITPDTDAVLSARAPFLSSATPAQETTETHQSAAVSQTRISDLPERAYVQTQGQWQNSSTVQIASAGNVFGASGRFASEEQSLELPLITPASPNRDKIAEAFGVKIYEDGQTIPLKFDRNLSAVEYEFGKDYTKYRMEIADGFFIETHEFPHVFMPASEESDIIITIGKQLEEKDQFALTNFLVPHGSAILVPGNTIHADALSTGKIIALLTHCTESDVVLLHKSDDTPLPIHIDNTEYMGLAEWVDGSSEGVIGSAERDDGPAKDTLGLAEWMV